MGKAKLFCALAIVAACDQPETKKVPSNNVSDIYADKNSIDIVDVVGASEEIFFAEKMDSNEVLDNGQVTLFDSVFSDSVLIDDGIVFTVEIIEEGTDTIEQPAETIFFDSETFTLEISEIVVVVGEDSIKPNDVWLGSESESAEINVIGNDIFDNKDQIETFDIVIKGEYCGEKIPGCEIFCPPDKQCREKQCGCKNSDEFECDDSALCTIGQVCVGLGAGIDGAGCCGSDKPTACGKKCCPSGSTCEFEDFEDGIDICIPPGYIYCGKGAPCDASKDKCWKDGCIPINFINCGEWFCGPEAKECGKKLWECYEDECYNNTSGTCTTSVGYGACIKSEHPEITGYISTCTPFCEVNEKCKWQGKNSCCQKVIVKYSETFSNEETVCVPKGGNDTCCGMLFECGEGCCLEDAVGCTKDGQTCLYPGEIECDDGSVCPEGTFCSTLAGVFCPENGSAKCEGGYYCPPGETCIDGDEKCCPVEQETCGNNSICCPIGFVCDDNKGICVPKIECSPSVPIVCQYTCCKSDQVCSANGKYCEDKCKPPTPVICLEKCCPNNYVCDCEEFGGLCRPGNKIMCDCQTETMCGSSEECILNEVCIASGYTCKTAGAPDCPDAPDCYCIPGDICTGIAPPCCPAEASVPCGDFCCPDDGDPSADEECVLSLKQCKEAGQEYCGKNMPGCELICPLGQQCMTKQCGCMENEQYECDDGVLCLVTQKCVGLGKGIDGSGCCDDDKPVACGTKCCDGGSTCAFNEGVDYCVPTGYIYCGGSTICDATKQKCWKNSTGVYECIPFDANDCGEWWCPSTEKCVSANLKCCPVGQPQACSGVNGAKCCLEKEKCYAGICGPDGSTNCPGAAPNKYCLPGYQCGYGKNGSCCCNNDTCMDSGGLCCSNYSDFGHYCNVGKQCCGSGCISSIAECCAINTGTHCPDNYKCSATKLGCYPKGTNDCLYKQDPGYCSGAYPNCQYKPPGKTYCCKSGSNSNCIEATDLIPYIYSPPPGP